MFVSLNIGHTCQVCGLEVGEITHFCACSKTNKGDERCQEDTEGTFDLLFVWKRFFLNLLTCAGWLLAALQFLH